MNYKIKKITSLKDADKIAEIIGVSLDEGDFPYKTKTRESYKKIFDKKFFRKFLKVKKHVILGAYENDKLVACIVLRPEDGGVLFVEWLVVVKKYRGEGVGSALLQQTEKWALKHKLHYIHLFTETEANREFYSKRGFQYVGTQHNSWFGENEHIFEKSLRDNPFEEIFKRT
jgi:GNAT superfamily N-acetyltransferase